MNLQPYGPVERAILEKTPSPVNNSNKHTIFFLGMFVGVCVCGLVWLSYTNYNARKSENES